MKESVAVAKEADAKKEVSPTKSDNSIHRVRDEPERELGSLRDVIGNISRDGGTPSVDSIATELSGMPTAQRASVLLALQQTHGNRYVQRVVAGIQAKQTIMQRNVQRSCSEDAEQIKRAAVEGVSGSSGRLPYLEKIQASFGAYDVTDVQAHVSGAAGKASDAIGAKAYTMGDHVAFKEVPDLRTAAHEAAHVVQQKSGVQLQMGVGQIGDVYERHADEVADRVVQGRSADDLLTRATGTALQQAVQMSYDEFMRLPRPIGTLFQEIEDLSLTDVNNLLSQMGTLQHPGDLWQRIEDRYVGETAELVYDRLRERRNWLLSEGQGEEVEQAREAGREEAASAEVVPAAEGEVHTPDEREAAMERFAREHHVPRSSVIWTPLGPQILFARVAPEEIPIEERTSGWTQRHWELMHRPRLRSEEIEEWTTVHSLDMVWERLTSPEGRSSSTADYKDRWVRAHRFIIRESASECDIPDWLVAGVAWIEVGGEPGYTDDLSYILGDIGIRGRPELVSYGPIAIQIRRAAEELGYDPNAISRIQTSFIISSLRDPQQNLFIVASHLHRLRNIDFPTRPADILTDDEIRIIATRYNRGPDLPMEAIQENTSYGDLIIRRKEALQRLLQD